jgi:hypothetical protein
VRYFRVLFFKLFALDVIPGVLHALGEVFLWDVFVGLDAVSLGLGFLLFEFVLALVGLVAVVDGETAFLGELGFLFFFIVDDGCLGGEIESWCGFFFEVALAMNFLDDFLVFVFDLLDFFFEVFELLM